jgi:SAM-dependent methyltransferase
MDTEAPVPPIALTARLAQAPTAWTDTQGYLERGRQALRAIERVLPADWTWSNKRVLDFGCGAGRTIRHLGDVNVTGELWGCDVDPACIAWSTEHLGPSISFVVNDDAPPLPFESEKFDLVYALSVFTHIDRHWANWLLELHRVLAPGGILVATIMSEAMCEAVSGQAWNESTVGMNVYECGQQWALGGPMVLHSPWWIREHWGRAFDVLEVRARDFFDRSGTEAQDNHGVVVLRKTGRPVTVAELERLDPSEPREAVALYHDVLHLRAETAALRALQRQEGKA